MARVESDMIIMLSRDYDIIEGAAGFMYPTFSAYIEGFS